MTQGSPQASGSDKSCRGEVGCHTSWAYQLHVMSYQDNKEIGKKDSEVVQVIGSSSFTHISSLNVSACMQLVSVPCLIQIWVSAHMKWHCHSTMDFQSWREIFHVRPANFTNLADWEEFSKFWPKRTRIKNEKEGHCWQCWHWPHLWLSYSYEDIKEMKDQKLKEKA